MSCKPIKKLEYVNFYEDTEEVSLSEFLIGFLSKKVTFKEAVSIFRSRGNTIIHIFDTHQLIFNKRIDELTDQEVKLLISEIKDYFEDSLANKYPNSPDDIWYAKLEDPKEMRIFLKESEIK